MHLTKESIQTLGKIERLNIINAVTGIKPANLIGTISEDGHENLAIFSSVVHLGSNPPLLGFVMRPTQDVPRHTYDNIMHNGFYTLNHVHEQIIRQAHYTSAKFDPEVSEFDSCDLTAEYLHDFKAPFVKESRLKLGMKFLQAIPITLNNTMLIIGEIQHAIIPNEALGDGGHLDLSAISSAGISGLNSYYALQKIGQFPYARVHEVPDFRQ